mmetsp:Transcript_66138/g.173407  ORF Transcript_66138/g.173407 Transcript_66138/m.173407 type:complete len:255 (-) Transcript_66138:83-847(-)
MAPQEKGLHHTEPSFIQPLHSFCCGCDLDQGIHFILIFHSFMSCFYITTTVFNIVLDLPTPGYHVSLAVQAFNCGFALAGLPFIVAGFIGVKGQNEIPLRLYLYWFLFTFCLDSCFMAVDLTQNSCKSVPDILAQAGGSFACGFTRAISVCTLGTYLGLCAYFWFVIWSRCEELRAGSSDAQLGKLLGQAVRRERGMVYQHRSGLFGTGPILSAPCPVSYGSMASPGMFGSARIFGGSVHDCNYPPMSAWKGPQ